MHCMLCTPPQFPALSQSQDVGKELQPFPLKELLRGGQRQGKASGRDAAGAGPGLSPAEAARSLPLPAGSHPHPRDAGQGHGPFPPIVRWRQGHGFLPVMSPTLTLA